MIRSFTKDLMECRNDFNVALIHSPNKLLYFPKAFMSKIFKTIRLIWTFYRSYILFSAIVTLFLVRIFWLYGFPSFFGIFWGKLFSLAIAYSFVHNSKKKEYYYYLNHGIGKNQLWITTLSFDFIVFILLLILTQKIS